METVRAASAGSGVGKTNVTVVALRLTMMDSASIVDPVGVV